MATTVHIDGYLVQAKLESALRQIVGAAAWRGSEQHVVHGKKLRWDMVFETSSGKVAGEYDGDEHYRNSLKTKIDNEKDRYARNEGYHVVRIPYWVQLTTETLKYYFELDAEIVQDFRHGFITTKIVFWRRSAKWALIGFAASLTLFRRRLATQW
ncbi:MAG: hypothetical protein ACOX6T_18095 [Myxococcales bacterium]|jgi:very-short-patch-repair endonuclease